tara:strand:+ start:132 stop:1598 length:1467 start_codon:yes stop_codon:yes gene_type:complete
MKTFSQFQNHAWFDSKPNLQKPKEKVAEEVDKIISEASDPFNIAIVKEKDFDLLPNTPKADLGDLKKILAQFEYVDKVPMAGQPSAKKFKIRTTDDDVQQKVRDWIKDNAPDLKPYITFGKGSIGASGGAKIHENTQELMVACLVLLGKKYGTVKHPDTNDLIREAEGKYSSVIGTKTRMELLDQFAENYNDLATAVSSSNAILDIVGSVSKVFWTGKGWDSEIAPFNPPMGNIKDYNSSDIVVLGGDGIYYGFSLKKKGSSKDSDPTLINKPITGSRSFLLGVIDSKDLDLIEKAKEDFFDLVIKKHYKLTPAKIRKLTDKEKGAKIRDISQRQMGTYLKSADNKFFKTADSVLRKGGGTKFAIAFLEQIFRTNLTSIEDAGQFKFYLLTGIGKNGAEQLSVESAEVKDLPSTVEALSKVIKTGVKTVPTKGQKQAWDKGAGHAKIKHTIESGRTPIVNIEVRYKGSYTANPQFQATATADFKALFK